MADLEESISKIAEKVYDLLKFRDSSLTQRRNLVTDMYGVEFTRNATDTSPATFYISVSPDLVYFERFQFKLIMSNTGAATDYRVKIDDLDVTPYLMAQYDNKWISGDGVYPDNVINHDYDILEVASDLVGEGRDADAEKLISPGYKKVEVSASTPFTVTMVLYLKLSHVNR